MNRMAVLWLVLAVAAGALLFKTSQQVTDGRQHLANITADIRREEDSLRVLQAEWSYLNQPDRLEKLSAQYLKLTPMKGKQFATADSLPLRPVPEDTAPAETPALLAAADAENAALNTVAAAQETAAIAPAAGMPAPAVVKAPMRKPAGLKAPAAAAVPAPAAPKAAPAKSAMPPQPATPKPAAATAAPLENTRSFGDVLNSLGGGL